MRLLPLLFMLISFQSLAQNDFAPLGAEWKYTYHNFVVDFPYDCEYNVCNQELGYLQVVDTLNVNGIRISVLEQENDNLPIYIISRNDSIFFFAENEFHLLYDFNAKDGDTIDISVPTFYKGPGALNASYYGEEDSVIHTKVLVTEPYSPIFIGGAERKVYQYESIDDAGVTIPQIIQGIGSGQAFFGYKGGFVLEGCFGYFYCYQDINQSYTPFGCCENPDPFPARKFAPLGAEWLYEGWSDGTPNTSGCIDYCEGNYNLFRVEDEKNFGGRIHAEVHRYHRTKNSDWQPTGDVIYLYDYDEGFYAHEGIYQFTNTYRTDVAIGDTINAAAVQSYPKWIGNDTWVESYPVVQADQIVESLEMIEIDGQMRKKINYRSLGDLQLGTVIEGIGPLFQGLLGTETPVPASGCGPRLICYRDSQITYITDEDCGCEFPMGPNAVEDIDPSNVSISPNPTQDVFKIHNTANINFETLEIVDMTGKSVLNTSYNNLLDIQNISQGLYFLILNGDEGRLIKKLVKN